MTDKPVILLAGRMTAPRLAQLQETLTTDWSFLSWTEDDPEEDLQDKARRADVIVAGRLQVAWPEMPRLRLYHIPFTGHDWIRPENLPRGCLVCNTYEHEIPVAEYVLATMLEREIGISAADQRFRSRGWDRQLSWAGADHGELFGKTIGIVGYGHIGKEVAVRAGAFGMRCLAVSRRGMKPAPPPLEWLGDAGRLDELLGESDYILIALPLSKETDGIIDGERMARMKPSGVIINVGRGPIVEEAALYEALFERRIGGAIIDVWYDYPREGDLERPPARFPFEQLDNVTMTPHFSAHSEAMRTRRWAFIAANIDRLARGETLQNVCFEGCG
jgi:phosphoglycerate dehydrogenase-like enzyme